MSHIDWGTTQAEQAAVVRRVIQQVVEDLYDNGQPGLITRVEDFMTTHRALDEERRRQHSENSRKLNLILAILMAIAAYIAIIVSISHPLKTLVDPRSVFHSQTDPQVAELNQYLSVQ